ncbi:MAG TPA: nuclear transport factor 2 family protein [Actinomycetes bacterium]|jgi:ketosteroid isomerase-like protein|nr:nuclear transport factor 2 family protein [Actinomycetes bacterium]
MVQREVVAAWLDAYVAAWRSYDPDAIGALFSEDATYAYHPWEEPLRGRTAIVSDWLANQDPPGSWEAAYQPVAVDGDVAVATGRSRYLEADGSLAREYWNCYLLAFDDQGRCRQLTEWFMLRTEAKVEG